MTSGRIITRFSFQPYAGDRPSPSMAVKLLGVNGAIVESMALVDTGAEWSIFPAPLAVRLGADVSLLEGFPSQTAGGQVDEMLWWNESREGLVRPEPAVRIMGRDIPLCPLLNPHNDVVALGREDFLSSFQLEVDQRERTFSLRLYQEPLVEWIGRTGRT